MPEIGLLRKCFILLMIMLVYFAKKNVANGPAAYSTLKPDTSSDFPIKLNEAWLVSVRMERNHMTAKSHDGKFFHRYFCVVMKVERG